MHIPRRSTLQFCGLAISTAFAGCSSLLSSDSSDTEIRETPPTDDVYIEHGSPKPGFVSLQAENNHSKAHELTVTVKRGAGEQVFDRTIALDPQQEPEFNDVLSVPKKGSRTYEVHAEGAGEQRVTKAFEITADGEFQNVHITINRDGQLKITQGIEPSEPTK